MQKYLAFPSHVFRSLFVEQQTGRLFIVYESKSNLTAYIERKSGNRLFTSVIVT